MRFLFIVFLVMLSTSTGARAHEDNAFCKAPEIVSEGDAGYNAYVCQALALLEAHEYAEAEAALEKASQIPLFEMPNFMLEPLFAAAKFGQADNEGGNDHLQKAELFLMVYAGILKCTTYDDDPRDLTGFFYGDRKLYPVEMIKGVANKMCWAGYESFLSRHRLGVIEHEYALLQRLQSVKEKYK